MNENLPPPHYETLTTPPNFQIPHPRYGEVRSISSNEFAYRQYNNASQPSNYESDRRQIRNGRNNINRGAVPRRVQSFEKEFEREFNGMFLHESENRRSSRPNDYTREDFRLPRREFDDQSRNERPRVRFHPNVPYNDGRTYEGNYGTRNPQLPRTSESPFRRNYPNPAAQAYDIMRKWDLKFSGAREEDPDIFIRKIRSGRAMIFVRDEDLLNLLPFFSSGIAARWYDVYRDRWATFENE